ncbi:MAG: biotin transporter BioY [Bacillota bacterium]
MKISTKDLVFCGIFAALIAVGAFLKIPVPPVSISMQTFFVTLAGLFLGRFFGPISVLVYIFIGLIGIPVFTSGGGFMYVFTPTFGYLLGFVLSAFLTGTLIKGKTNPSVKELSIAVFVGAISTYLIAIPYYFLLTQLYFGTEFVLSSVLWSFFVIFIPGDIAKCVVAVVVGKKLLPVYKQIRN